MTTGTNIQQENSPVSLLDKWLHLWRSTERAIWPRVALVVLLKIVLMTLFSSDYENKLFLPFVEHYLNNFDNPWDYFYQTSERGDEFPYQPLMLYVLSVACFPLKLMSAWQDVLLRNFFFKLPTLLSDVAIMILLLRMFPSKHRHIFWFYFVSPIILYACYLHSQLDLIPTAMLFATFYFLRKSNWLPAFIFYGLALATKLHVLAAFPLIAIFLYRNQKYRQVLNFGVISLATYLLIAAPFFASPGFYHLVLNNPRQSRVFEVFVPIGDLKIYLPILATFLAYGRFALYHKINTDLLDAFIAMVFSAFVLLIVPAAGWYVWMTPFLCLFLIKHYRKNRQLAAPFIWLNFWYVIYFVFFDKPDYVDLVFMDRPIHFKFYSERLQGFVFTLLEVGLLSNILLCYRAGVRSNAIYQRDRAVVIGIAGDSGSGKSTLLGDIKGLLLDRVVEVEGDGDHKWERGDAHWEQLTHLDPKANFLHRQADAILSLKRWKTVKRPEYDHTSGKLTTPKVLLPNDFIIISGLHTLYLPKMRKVIDLKVFMEPERQLQVAWKVERDLAARGYTAEQVTDQIEKRQPDVAKFIAPQKEFADLVIQYFTDEETKQMGLRMSLSSSVHLEDLVQSLTAASVRFFWDYSNDLSRQEIMLFEPIPSELLKRLVNELIANPEEVLSTRVEWREGYRGFVQLILLVLLAELMKEKEDAYVN